MNTKPSAAEAAFSHPSLAALLDEGVREGRLPYHRLHELLGDLQLDADGLDALFEVLEQRGVALYDDRAGNVRLSHQPDYRDDVAPAKTKLDERPRQTQRRVPSLSTQETTAQQPNVAASAPAAKPRSSRHGDLDDVLASLNSLMNAAPGVAMGGENAASKETLSTQRLLDEASRATPAEMQAAFADEDENDIAPDAPVADAFSQYMNQMGRVPLLSAAEERDLAERARDGSNDAKQKLVEANLRLVVHLARPYAGRAAMPLLDVVQEGNVGLMRAVERFDPSRGQRLASFATWYIREAINKAVAAQSRSIRLPAHLSALLHKMQRTQRELTQQNGREPYRHELAEAMGVEIGQVEELQRLNTTPLSLDAPTLGDDESDEFGERLLTEENADDESVASLARGELKSQLEGAMEKLSRRERTILMQRFGLGEYSESGARTVDDIAVSLNLSRDRVRELEVRALRKLRRKTALGHHEDEV